MTKVFKYGKGIYSRAGVLPALSVFALLVVGISGCDAISSIMSLFSRSGADLSLKLKPDIETIYRVQVNAVVPMRTVGDGKAPSSKTIELTMKIRVRTGAEKSGKWIPVGADVMEGKYEINGKLIPAQLVGRKMSFKYSALRRISQWQGLSFPAGVELLEIGPPKGRVQEGEKWKIETVRVLLYHEEKVAITKFYQYQGEGNLNGQECYKLAVTVTPVKATFGNGAVVELSGSGEVWISKKDGTIYKATEILEGRLTDDKEPAISGQFAQAISLYAASVAPAKLPSLLTVPAGTSATVSTATPVSPNPATSGSVASLSVKSATAAASAKPVSPKAPSAGKTVKKAPVGAAKSGTVAETRVERLVYVSNATGKRAIWSAAPDGSAKKCLTGYAFHHWGQSLDSKGRTMVVVSERADGVNLWSYDLALGSSVPLTEFGEREDMSVGWADGGNIIVMIRNEKLWSIHRDGFNLRTYDLGGRVVDFDATERSREVAVVLNKLNRNSILLVDVVSGSVRELVEGDLPSWSRDATKIAFRRGNILNVIMADASDTWPILERVLADSPILWSPDGNRLVFTVRNDDSLNAVMVSSRRLAGKDGAKVTKVTRRGGEALAIAADGKQIAYLLYGDLWLTYLEKDVHMRVTSDGTASGPIWWGKHSVR